MVISGYDHSYDAAHLAVREAVKEGRHLSEPDITGRGDLKVLVVF